ncbi:Sensor protein PhoQ [Thalassocella blandensis]|nr:Sensor protein PhoQ [Thalassocella blandensis]
MLDRAFRNSLYNAEKESLLAHTYSMMGVAEPDGESLMISQGLSDPRFSTPASGLYAQLVRSEDQYIVWQSTSLSVSPVNSKIPFHEVDIGNRELLNIKINGTRYFISRFNTVWEIGDEDQQYQFVIIHSQKQLDLELKSYRRSLAVWLGGLALLLIFVQTAIIRWGLLPLNRLASDIGQLETGRIDKLDESYPQEIVPVTQSINLLLESEQKQQKRYKNTLADLAHSLKTPLSVIRSILESDQTHHHSQSQSTHSPGNEWKLSIDEQIDRMSSIVNHQLNRASAKSKAAFQSALPLQPMFARIGAALEKVYRDKHIRFQNKVAANARYPAEEGDLMEVFGNILENAFKYGNSEVCVTSEVVDKHLRIYIDDNGEGIPTDLHQDILLRGARVDTSLPGQGIGLSVAADIISTYDGGICIDQAPSGGARFIIDLPL